MGTGQEPGRNGPIIEVRDLVATWGEREVLRGVSMRVEPQEIRVILGPSGCGKSTLLKHVVGLLQPVAGSIHLFDREIVGMDENELASLLADVGMVFQAGALIQSMTVLENVMLPLKEHTSLAPEDLERVARTKLAVVGLAPAASLLPSQLSGGMQKRAALARAIALDPAILLCDEPTAGLDPVTAAGIDRLLLDLRGALGITVVAVSHELSSIRRIADRITMLVDGEVVAEGTPAELEDSEDPRVRGFFQGLEPPRPARSEVEMELFVD
jgi:phospholipid/cholesterol/gamma-HCH transport system ATP-binding protein